MQTTPDPDVASGPDAAIRQGSALVEIYVAHELNRDGWDRVIAVSEQLTDIAGTATQGDDGIHEAPISLADMLSCLQARHNQTSQQPGQPASSTPNSLGSFSLGLPSASVRARIEFDARVPAPDAAEISAALHSLQFVYGRKLGKCLDLASQLDCMDVSGSDDRIMRLRELLTGSDLPMRPDDVRLSQIDVGNAIANGIVQENSNSIDSSGGSTSSMDSANNEDVEMD